MGISKLVRKGKIHRRKRICTGSRAFPGRFLRAFCCHRLSGALQGLSGLRSIPRLSGSPSRLSGCPWICRFSSLLLLFADGPGSGLGFKSIKNHN